MYCWGPRALRRRRLSVGRSASGCSGATRIRDGPFGSPFVLRRNGWETISDRQRNRCLDTNFSVWPYCWIADASSRKSVAYRSSERNTNFFRLLVSKIKTLRSSQFGCLFTGIPWLERSEAVGRCKPQCQKPLLQQAPLLGDNCRNILIYNNLHTR